MLAIFEEQVGALLCKKRHECVGTFFVLSPTVMFSII